MKNLAVLALFVGLACMVLARPQDDKYTDQYDSIDIDEILRTTRLLDNYINCLKGIKNCGAEAQKLKEILPDALKTGCKKCSELQKTRSKKVIDHLIRFRATDFKDLETLYDPQRVYRTEFAEELKKEGIVLPD